LIFHFISNKFNPRSYGLSSNGTIDIYTNGSRKEINKTMKAGYGVYNATENKSEIGRIGGIQEIYKAELTGILRGIQLCDNNTKINIFTNSESAYKTINKAKESTRNENLKSQMIPGDT
jgi:ribonuclease HI